MRESTRRMDRLTTVAAAAALLLCAGLARPAQAKDEAAAPSLPAGQSPSQGPADAPVTIVEFSDFQCPFCNRVQPTLRQLRADYGDQLRLVFKHNPLAFHKDAWPAATASMAAGEQGKFWEMHDKLFANQRQLKREDLDRYAMELGLNMAKFARALDAKQYDAQIKADQALAAKFGARGTPGFFINGIKLSGAQPLDKFKVHVDAEVAEAKKLAAQGIKAKDVYARRAAVNLKAAPPRAGRGGGPRAIATEERYRIEVGDAHGMGPADAPVTIIESSDFQCPFCSRVTPTLKKIRDEYGDKVRIHFKHNPLPFHKQAWPAAEACEAAGAQGRFWEMHDTLFANQKKLKDEDLERYATELGLNMARFKADMKKRSFKDKVTKDQAQVTKLGARGTPGFFVNGRRMSGARPFDQFKQIIDEELKVTEALRKRGVAKSKIYAELMKDALTEAKARPPSAARRRNQPDPAAIYKVELRGDEASKGPEDALVTIVEYSDFQCPFCKRVGPTINALLKEHDEDLRVVWKHNPLPFHRAAGPAAQAAEAAKEQGKFWEMHDLLFANQRKLDADSLRSYAQQLGLNMAKFERFTSSNAAGEIISSDQALAKRLGANGTPAFFINGRNLRGAQPQSAFDKVIKEELERARAALKSGAKRKGLYATLIKDGATGPKRVGDDAKAAVPAAATRHPFRIRPGDPMKGGLNAKVTIVEWLDFQCPYCNRAQATLAQIEAEYGDRVRIVVKQNPLAFHNNADVAARAALAAHEQGKFWPMHDLLFDNQKALSRADLDRYAKELNLDLPRFARAVDGTRFDKWLKDDLDQASAADIRGTPAFLVNGLSIKGAQPFAEFKRLIDAELAAPAK